MIVAWTEDEIDGVVTKSTVGIFDTDDDAKRAIEGAMATGKKVLAGDVVPITAIYIPARIDIKR